MKAWTRSGEKAEQQGNTNEPRTLPQGTYDKQRTTVGVVWRIASGEVWHRLSTAPATSYAGKTWV